MAEIPVSRSARAGCMAGKSASCARMSGDALNRIQCSPSSLRAMDDWVRARALRVPLRKPEQFRQLQFHWGKPPPAPEPRIRICMGDLLGRNQTASTELAVCALSGWQSTWLLRNRCEGLHKLAWSTRCSPLVMIISALHVSAPVQKPRVRFHANDRGRATIWYFGTVFARLKVAALWPGGSIEAIRQAPNM